MVQFFFSLENPSWVVLYTFCITVWRYMTFAISFKRIIIYFGLLWVCVAARGLSVVAVTGGYSLAVVWPSHCSAFLVMEHGL